MGQVIRFPPRAATPGTVYCRPIDLLFPVLYRGWVKTTAEDLAQYDLDPAEHPPSEWVVYDLDQARSQLIGAVEWTVAKHILTGDREESFVIRHHPTPEGASAYLDGHFDTTFDVEVEATEGGLYHSDAGIFTMISRPTLQAWPGPLLIYLADVPADNLMGWDDWAFIVGPDGEPVDPGLLGY